MPIKDAASIQKLFFQPYIMVCLLIFFFFLLYKIVQNSAKHAWFWQFLGAAAIQKRPLLAQVRYVALLLRNASNLCMYLENFASVSGRPFVMAACLKNGDILLLRSYDDVIPQVSSANFFFTQNLRLQSSPCV